MRAGQRVEKTGPELYVNNYPNSRKKLQDRCRMQVLREQANLGVREMADRRVLLTQAAAIRPLTERCLKRV